MTLVIALPDLALRLSGLLKGARYIVKVDDGTDLRHQVHAHQPDVILLDWRIGGNAWRAVDEITAIVERTTTHPYVIALLPWVDKQVKIAAARSGCYGAVSVSDARADRLILEAVKVAQRARGMRKVAHRRVSRENLH